MQGLVVYAFLPAVLYCIPHDSEVVQYMTTKKGIPVGNNEFKIGYDRSQPNPEELGDFSKETSFYHGRWTEMVWQIRSIGGRMERYHLS
nr:unnamed protein product [Callosobruchus chinensis]